MVRYHIIPVSMTSAICKARSSSSCRYGGEHYPTQEEARHARDEINDELNQLIENGGPYTLESKYAIVRAECLRMGAPYNGKIVREDDRIVKKAAIDCGYDVTHFYKDRNLKQYVKSYLARAVQSMPNRKLERFATKDYEMFDEHRNEMAKRSIMPLEEPAKLEDLASYANMPDGGGTLSWKRMVKPSKGFCYSPYPQYSEVYYGDVSEDRLKSILEEYSRKHESVLSKDNHYLGFWRDPKGKGLYIDVSVVSQDASQTRTQCKKNDQIAFFDLQTFHSVEVDANATSGQGFAYDLAFGDVSE